MSADLLIGGRAGRSDHPPVGSVIPEGWEDIDCYLTNGVRAYVQAKERGFESRPIGQAEIADVITHAATSLADGAQLPDGALIGLVTDGVLGSGLDFTGWARSITEDLSSKGESGIESLKRLVLRLEKTLETAGLDPALTEELLALTSLIHRPWHLSAEIQRELEATYRLPKVSASIAYALVVAELAERAAQQRSTSYSAPKILTVGDVDAIITELLTAIDVASLEEAYRAGVCEPIDYLHESDTTSERFFAGVDVSPSHIAAGLDVIRVEELEQVLSGLHERSHVLVAGPSGSGKSALLWRAGRIVARGARTLRVLRVASDEDVDLLVRQVRRERPMPDAPVLVCGDHVGSQSMAKWSEALTRLREIPSVLILSAVRREDFAPALVGDGVVVEARLTPSSAVAIYEHLVHLKFSVLLEIEEAIDLAEGLLMEFLALLTTGRRLRDVLADQVSGLRVPERFLQREALRLVCAAHSLGSALEAEKLGAHLKDKLGVDLASVGDALDVLAGEHLILHDDLGHWRGLHDLRTEILQGLLHASPPPTLVQTFAEVVLLLPDAAQAFAIRRAAEHVCQIRGTGTQGDDPAALLAELIQLLKPMAIVARDLLRIVGDDASSASRSAALLETGERIDSVAYVYALLPWLEANRAPTIDVATLAGLLYTIRNDGIRMPDFGGGPVLNKLADSLPSRPIILAEMVGEGIDGAALATLALSAPIDVTVRLLEAAENLVTLTPDQAATIWRYHVPSLSSPPGDGFDLIACERRAQLAAVLSQLANLKGTPVAEALGPTRDRALDGIATDTFGLSVSLAFERKEDENEDDEWVPAAARKETWSQTERLVADARLYSGRSEKDSISSYAPQPGSKPGPDEDARRACQRLLDACPELDRAHVRALAANGELPTAGGHTFGEKNIRSGVLRRGVSVRRNVSFQAALARAVAGKTWSARMRNQVEVAADILTLCEALPRRFRAFDNLRRRKEWKDHCRAVDQRVAELPSRPLDREHPNQIQVGVGEDADAQSVDERDRQKDLSKEALSLFANSLTQAAGGLDPFNPSALTGAAARLLEVPSRLGDARSQGAPVFASVGDTLPSKLDQEAIRTSSLLLAIAGDDETRVQMEKAKSDAEANNILRRVIEVQADADRQLLAGRLNSTGVPVIETLVLPDPSPLLGRLDGGRTLALVPISSWDMCVRSLESWTPGERKGAKGHLLVAAVDDDDLLPVALQITADTGSLPLPIVDEADFMRIAQETGRHLRQGAVGALVSEAVSKLLEWSLWATRRANRDASWAEPPPPFQTPLDIKSALLAAKDKVAGSSAATSAIEALCDLADLVANEDGTVEGLAVHLADVISGRDTDAPAIVLMNVAVSASLEIDQN